MRTLLLGVVLCAGLLAAPGLTVRAQQGDNGTPWPAAAPDSPPPPTLYAVSEGGSDTGSGTLWVIDRATAASTAIGPTNVPDLTDVAVSANGTLYAVSATTLYRLDPATGAATFLMTIGTGVNALVGRKNGLLYAATNTGLFLSIDPVALTVATIGSFGGTMYSSGDLAISKAGTVYAIVSGGFGNQVVMAINPATGAASAVGPGDIRGTPDVTGIVFDWLGPTNCTGGCDDRLLAVSNRPAGDATRLVVIDIIGSPWQSSALSHPDRLSGLASTTEACAVTPDTTAVAIGPQGGTFTIPLTASQAICGWTVSTATSFITVTSPAAGTGSSVVDFKVPPNPLARPRSGTIAAGDLVVTITQAANPAARRVPLDADGDGLTDIGVFRPASGQFLFRGRPSIDWGAAGDVPVPGDYDGDGNPDAAVFRPSNGTWYIRGGAAIQWGEAGDIPVPGDYDGNGTTDVAVFHPATGAWRFLNGPAIVWGAAGDVPVPADYDGDGRTDIGVYRRSTGIWYVRDQFAVSWGFANDLPVPADYNADGKADVAVFRPANGTWFVKDQFTLAWGVGGDIPAPLDRNGDGIPELGVFRRATGSWYFYERTTGVTEAFAWGLPADIPLGVPLQRPEAGRGDTDGDGRADLTVLRPSTGQWLSLGSVSGYTEFSERSWGLVGDLPAAGDYDGDGKVDPAVFRPSTGAWYVLLSSSGFTTYLSRDWGLPDDIPVAADYDGDGRADIAVFRPSEGRWLILLSSNAYNSSLQVVFGQSGDIPVPADYDGDGRRDIAVFRPSLGRWFIFNRLTGTSVFSDWGIAGDAPTAADFDGDGKADLAVFRPSNGRWFIQSSIDGAYTVADWGLAGDTVVPADYDGDGKAEIAVFRPSTGMWYVRGLFNRSWGLAGDAAALKNP